METTKTDNELIAEFMGATIYTDWGLYLDNTYYKFKHPSPKTDSKLTHEEIEYNRATQQLSIWNPRYDTSWDWLMPVVEKIETLGYVSSILGLQGKNYSHSCTITHKESNAVVYGRGVSDSKIEATYKAVVEFINHKMVQSANSYT